MDLWWTDLNIKLNEWGVSMNVKISQKFVDYPWDHKLMNFVQAPNMG